LGVATRSHHLQRQGRKQKKKLYRNTLIAEQHDYEPYHRPSCINFALFALLYLLGDSTTTTTTTTTKAAMSGHFTRKAIAGIDTTTTTTTPTA
jgi:hypothetical protein